MKKFVESVYGKIMKRRIEPEDILPEPVYLEYKRIKEGLETFSQNFDNELQEIILSYSRKRSNMGALLAPLFYEAVSSRINLQMESISDITLSCSLFIMASSMQDDVMDKDALRGTSNERSINFLVLASDLCIAEAYRLLSTQDQAKELTKYANENLIKIVNAQRLDCIFTSNVSITKDDYTMIVEGKTGGFGALCAGLGVIIARGSDTQFERAQEYGRNLGVGLQFIDDLQELQNDIYDGKFTLATIHAKEKNPLLGEQLMQPQTNIEEIVAVINNLGGRDYVKEKTRERCDRAAFSISDFPESPAKQLLLEILQMVKHVIRKKRF